MSPEVLRRRKGDKMNTRQLQKAVLLLSISALSMFFANCAAKAQAQTAGSVSGGQAQGRDASGVLIAYFSTSGVVDRSLIDQKGDAATQASIVIPNMEIVAGFINETIGGTLFSIRTVKKYPVGMNELNAMGYAELAAQARPELSTRVENMGAYDTIYLCYPNWCGSIPMAVATFLEEYDFSGKTIIASCTHFGSGFGSSIQDIEKLSPKAKVVRGYNGSGRNIQGTKNAVVDWAKRSVK
jgi:flavodoxin